MTKELQHILLDKLEESGFESPSLLTALRNAVQLESLLTPAYIISKIADDREIEHETSRPFNILEDDVSQLVMADTTDEAG